jgi:hypothetical protein
MRKAAHEGLNKGVVKDFHEPQTKEALLLAAGGLAEPGRWDTHLRRAAASMVLSVVYDQPTIKSEQDKNVKLINDFDQRLTRAAYPGAHLEEFFLRMGICGSETPRPGNDWYQHSAMFEGLFNSVYIHLVRTRFCSTILVPSLLT